MEGTKVYCDECGACITPEEPMCVDRKGQMLHVKCLMKDVPSGLSSIKAEALIDLISFADKMRLTTFYISYMRGAAYNYMASKEPYPHLFSIYVTRQEVVDALVAQTSQK